MVRGEVRWLVNRIPEMAHTLLRGSWRLRHPAIHGNFLHARYCDRHPQILKHALSASVRSEQEDLSNDLEHRDGAMQMSPSPPTHAPIGRAMCTTKVPVRQRLASTP